jgi:hypothetical protein
MKNRGQLEGIPTADHPDREGQVHDGPALLKRVASHGLGASSKRHWGAWQERASGGAL